VSKCVRLSVVSCVSFVNKYRTLRGESVIKSLSGCLNYVHPSNREYRTLRENLRSLVCALFVMY
jgi:hypothetical protein